MVPVPVRPCRVLLLAAEDLLFTARIGQAAEALGLPIIDVTSPLRAQEAAADSPGALAIVDLGLGDERALEIIRSLRKGGGASTVEIIAFGSHVDTGLMDRARSAGCNRVLPRSAFRRDLPRLLAAGGMAGEG